MSIDINKYVTDEVKQSLIKISKAAFTEKQVIVEEFIKILSDDFVQKDPQFKTDEQRARYALSCTATHFSDRRPVAPYDVIPVGIGAKRIAKSSNKPYIELFVNVNKKFNRIMVRDVDGISNVQFDQRYKQVHLSKLGKKESSNFESDDRAKWERPEFVPDFKVEDHVPITEVTLSDIGGAVSEVNDKGYIIGDKWVAVTGFIKSKGSGINKFGGEWGRYTITGGFSTMVMSDDTVIESITLWLSPVLMIYDPDSECKFYGVVRVTADNEVQMDCYRIEPIVARRSA